MLRPTRLPFQGKLQGDFRESCKVTQEEVELVVASGSYAVQIILAQGQDVLPQKVANTRS